MVDSFETNTQEHIRNKTHVATGTLCNPQHGDLFALKMKGNPDSCTKTHTHAYNVIDMYMKYLLYGTASTCIFCH